MNLKLHYYRLEISNCFGNYDGFSAAKRAVAHLPASSQQATCVVLSLLLHKVNRSIEKTQHFHLFVAPFPESAAIIKKIKNDYLPISQVLLIN